jgi:hypothetical protein
MLLQYLCAKKYVGDIIISKSSAKTVRIWLDDAEKVDQIVIQRYYFPIATKRIESVTLHGFADASKGANCAVVIYLCVETEDGYVTSLVASKSRVNALTTRVWTVISTPITIPRLELITALILARLIPTIMEALSGVINIEKIYCWTDSITVYYWIQSNREFKQFVQNSRIDEILKQTNAENWRHCAGKTNPADIGSRGCLPSELVSNDLWWNGPTWLKQSPLSYPMSEKIKETEDQSEYLKELRVKATSTTTATNLVKETTSVKNSNLSKIIDITRFSSLAKLLRVTALVFRFVKILKAKHSDYQCSGNIVLTAAEITEARNSWIRNEKSGGKTQAC